MAVALGVICVRARRDDAHLEDGGVVDESTTVNEAALTTLVAGGQKNPTQDACRDSVLHPVRERAFPE